MKHLLIVEEEQRRKLKEMLSTLYPEYKHITIGQDNVSMSSQKLVSIDMNWKKYHWFILLLGETLKRLYSLKRVFSPGEQDEVWLKDLVNVLVRAVMYEGAEHPIDTVYREYKLIMQAILEKKRKPNFQRV